MDAHWSEYFLLALVWSAYGAVHSLLISPAVMRRIRDRFPDGHRFHRLCFNSFSILTLIPIGGYTMSLKAPSLFSWDGPLRGLQALLIATGLALIAAGAWHYDFKEFLGLTQIRKTDACRGIGGDCELNTAGILGLVRHPWYTAVFLLLWARDLDPAAITVNTVLTVYVIVGTHLEERKLVAAFGPAYRDYQVKVSMFVPLKWLATKFRRQA